MLDMREELRRQGRNVPMDQMSALAGPRWRVSVLSYAKFHKLLLEMVTLVLPE